MSPTVKTSWSRKRSSMAVQTRSPRSACQGGAACMRKVRPRTIEGFERWLRRLPMETRDELIRLIRTRVDTYDRSAYFAELVSLWKHHELGETLPQIGQIARKPKTPEFLHAMLEAERRAAIRHRPTSDRERILLYKTPDAQRNKHRSRPVPPPPRRIGWSMWGR